MTEVAVSILLLFLLILMIWQGIKQGFRAELVKFGFFVLAALVLNPDWLGDMVIRIINGIYLLFLIAFNGGIQMIVSGNFSSENLNKVMTAAQEKMPLVGPEQKHIVLFILMLILILLGFVISAKVKTKTRALLGAFMGLFNGLLLAYIASPLLIGATGILPDINTDNPFEAILGIFKTALDVVITPLMAIIESLGPWAIVIAIVVIVIIAASSLRTRSS